MNEELYKVCENIKDSQAETERVEKIQTLEELYGYFLAEIPGLSEEEFDDFIARILENYEKDYGSKSKLEEEDLENVAGGFGLGTKIVSGLLALLTFLPAVGATNKKTPDNSLSPAIASMLQRSKNKTTIEKSGLEKIKDWVKKNKKTVIGIGAALVALISAGVVYKLASDKKQQKEEGRKRLEAEAEKKRLEEEERQRKEKEEAEKKRLEEEERQRKEKEETEKKRIEEEKQRKEEEKKRLEEEERQRKEKEEAEKKRQEEEKQRKEEEKKRLEEEERQRKEKEEEEKKRLKEKQKQYVQEIRKKGEMSISAVIDSFKDGKTINSLGIDKKSVREAKELYDYCTEKQNEFNASLSLLNATKGVIDQFYRGVSSEELSPAQEHEKMLDEYGKCISKIGSTLKSLSKKKEATPVSESIEEIKSALSKKKEKLETALNGSTFDEVYKRLSTIANNIEKLSFKKFIEISRDQRSENWGLGEEFESLFNQFKFACSFHDRKKGEFSSVSKRWKELKKVLEFKDIKNEDYETFSGFEQALSNFDTKLDNKAKPNNWVDLQDIRNLNKDVSGDIKFLKKNDKYDLNEGLKRLETQVKIQKYLKDHNFENSKEGREKAFLTSVYNQDLETVKLLLEDKNINVNVTSERGENALFLAVRKFNKEILALLLKKKINVNARNFAGETVLQQAVRQNQKEAVQMLLDAGANVNVSANGGLTVLEEAICANNEDVLNMLFEKNVDVNLKDADGGTPLMWAASSSSCETIKLLLSRGAYLHAEDKYKRTALMYASEDGSAENVRLLLDRGANVNAKDEDERTALMYATEAGNVESVELLLDHGADVNAVDTDGRTARSIASEMHKTSEAHKKILELFSRSKKVDWDSEKKAKSKRKKSDKKVDSQQSYDENVQKLFPLAILANLIDWDKISYKPDVSKADDPKIDWDKVDKPQGEKSAEGSKGE